ncbi:MAG: glutathione S-transferase [Gammaproteobacteria bacterium]|nr:glutathione S-transferase [Gammaproteobacteria bacterium]
MSQSVLYSFRRCPYAMRARLAIFYSGLQVELREVVLKNKPQTMLNASAKGTVPVLVLEDRVIDESLDIMQWSLTHNDRDGWLAGTRVNLELQSLADDELINQHDTEFKPLLDRYKYFDRHPEKTQEEHLQTALPFLAELEDRIKLNGDGKFLALNRFSIQDAAIFPFIRQFAHSDLKRFYTLNLPLLQQWLNTCLESSLFKQIMFKYEAWSELSNNAVIFGERVR